MSNLKQVVYLTEAQYESLLAGNTVGRLTGIDPDALYVTDQTVSMTDLTGILPVSKGGTGLGTLTSGYALIGNGTNNVTLRGIRNNTSKGTLGWTSVSTDNTLITTNTLAYWDGSYSGTSSNITRLGTIASGTWQGSVIGASYGGTGQNTLNKSANALINALDTGSDNLTANDYVITQYVGGGTTTTTYHRRPANKVINATLVKAALGTDSSTTNQWLNKSGNWSTPTAANVGAVATISPSTDDAIVRFNGTSGAIQNSGVTIDDNDNINFPTASHGSLMPSHFYHREYNENSHYIYAHFYDQTISGKYNSGAEFRVKTDEENKTYKTLIFRGDGIFQWDGQNIAHYGNVSTGDSNGQVKIAGKNITVKGISDLAYISKPSSNQTTTWLRGDGSWQSAPVTSVAGNTGAIDAATLRTSLGLSNAMHFLGITTTDISSGTANTTATVSISGSNKTAVAGDVVIDNSNAYEYVWTGSAWERLGPDGSYKTLQTAFSNNAGTADSTNTSNSFIYSFSQTTNGNIIDIKTRALPITLNVISTAAYGTTGWEQLKGTNTSGHYLTISKPSDSVDWGAGAHSAAITYGTGDTKGMLDINFNSPVISFAGGNASGSTAAAPKWYFKLSATAGKTYTLPSDSKTLAATDGSNIANSAISNAQLKNSKIIIGNKTINLGDTVTIAQLGISTQDLTRPAGLVGVNDVTYQALINDVRANRLAFLPADQIIIEKTTDGGSSWVDAGVSDIDKARLFSEKRECNLSFPKINNLINANCGLRFTITAMKYNVPAGTAETQKYNYWNSNYIKSQERYCQLKNMYFWVTTCHDRIKVKVERATGAASTNWVTAFEKNDYLMSGWPGNNIISFNPANFGGGSTQVDNPWNWRITLMSVGPDGSSNISSNTTTSHTQTIMEIRAYGDFWWGKATEYMASDHLYGWDYQKNAIFPADILPKVNNNKNVGSSSYKWANVYATNFNGTATAATNDSAGNQISTTYVKLTGDTMTGDLKANSSAALGTAANPWHNLVLGGATNATMTASSTNPRITFQENTGTQPVHLIYTDLDSYRGPAGLKVIGGTSATPAWFEVEGAIYNGGNIYSSGSLNITKAGECGLEVNNTQTNNPNQGAFIVGASGNLGIYSRKHSKWVVYSDASGNVVLNGNANTATSAGKWTTARSLTIGYKAQNVDGSGTVTWNLHDILYNPDITIAQTTSWNTIIEPGVYGVASANAFTGDGHPGTDQDAPYTYGQLIVMRSSSKGAVQIYINDGASNGGSKNKGLRYRSGWDVNNNDKTWEQKWKSWATILDNRNFNFFAPKLDGTGATGTWNITATTATTATNLANNPSISTTNTTQIQITAGGKTSSAYTVPYATTSRLFTHYQGRLETPDLQNTSYLSKFFTFLSSSSMTTNKPSSDGIIIYGGWDNGGWATELFLPTTDSNNWGTRKMQYRAAYTGSGNSSVWQPWRTILDEDNFATYVPDTKNTAGSTNSTSKLYLIGATSHGSASTQTYSYQYTYTNNGLLSATKLGLNASGTEKVHMEWNATDLSLDFIFD